MSDYWVLRKKFDCPHKAFNYFLDALWGLCDFCFEVDNDNLGSNISVAELWAAYSIFTFLAESFLFSGQLSSDVAEERFANYSKAMQTVLDHLSKPRLSLVPKEKHELIQGSWPWALQELANGKVVRRREWPTRVTLLQSKQSDNALFLNNEGIDLMPFTPGLLERSASDWV